MKHSNEIPGAAALTILVFLAAAAVLVAVTHPTIAAVIGSAELSVLGIPQLVKNFRERASAKDVSLETTLIWFFVAFFLSLVSWIRLSSGWYILLNVAGVVESAALLAQVAAYARLEGAIKKCALSAVAAALSGILALGGLLVGRTTWAYLLFPAAMGLLIVMNVPQIIKTYDLYRREGTPPKITPLYPALVVSGSFLHLIVAMKLGDSFWAFNSVVAVASASLILGQILLPDTTNLVVGQVVELVRPLRSEWA